MRPRPPEPGGPEEPLPSEDGGLARQRTALAWSRTGVSFALGGAVLLKLFDEADAGAAPLWLAVALVLLGSIAWWWGWRTPDVSPAIDSRAGRATAAALAVGLAGVAAAAVALQL